MKKRFKRTLSVFLTLSMLLGATVFTNVSAMSAPSETPIVSGEAILEQSSAFFSSTEPIDNNSPETAMIYEAAAIGMMHYVSILEDLPFRYDPNANYSELLDELIDDDSFQREFTAFVSSYALGNLQNLYDLLIAADYPQSDIDLFIERWTTALTRIPLMDIWQIVFAAGNGMEEFLAPLPEEEPIEDLASMIGVVFGHYYETIFLSFFEPFADALSQDAFGMSYMEAEELYHDTQPWYDFEETRATYRDLTSYAYEWVLASYLKNLAPINGVFDETGMVKDAISIGMFAAMTSTLGASFQYDPNKTYDEFWPATIEESGASIDALAAILECNIGDAAPLQAALTDAGYSHIAATAFIHHMAEVFAYQSLQNIKEALASDDTQAVFVNILDTPALTEDIEDMVSVFLDYYSNILSDMLEESSWDDEHPEEFTLSILAWAGALYLQNFAKMNYIAIPPGVITTESYPIKNAGLKADLTAMGITIGFAEANEIDVSLVDINAATMQALIDAIMVQDLADLGVMLHGILLRKGVIAEDLLIFSLLSILLSNEDADEYELVGFLRALNSVPTDELFAELDELEEALKAEAEEDSLGQVSGRVLKNLAQYFLTSWEAIGQRVDGLFGEGDNTLSHVLPWVTALYLKNLAELNADELVLNKSRDVVTKEMRQNYTPAEKELIEQPNLEAAFEAFALDNSEIYDTIDVEQLIDRYNNNELDETYLTENIELYDAILMPLNAATELLERKADGISEDFPVAGAAMRTASNAMSTMSSCSTGSSSSPISVGCGSGSPIGCKAGDSITVKIIEGTSHMTFGETITLEVTVKLSDTTVSNNNIVWSVDSVPSGLAIPFVDANLPRVGSTATFTAANFAGNARIVVALTDNQGRSFERSVPVKVSAEEPIVTLFNQQIDDGNGGTRVKNTAEYNHDLGVFSMYLSYAAYNPLPRGFMTPSIPGSVMTIGDEVKDVLQRYDFNIDKNYVHKHYNNWLIPNLVGHSIAHKDIMLDGEERPLIVVVVRGSAPDIDWFTNLISGLEVIDLPAGFRKASYEVRDNLRKYINGKGLKDPVVLVTGHSLGAAVANLLAEQLTTSQKTSVTPVMGAENTYAYTFAAPTVVREDSREAHKNIFNFLNNCNNHREPTNFGNALCIIRNDIVGCCDVVTHVPHILLQRLDPQKNDPWSRHGQEAHFSMEPYPSRDEPHLLAPIEETLLLDAILMLILGDKNWMIALGGHHGMATYLKWMEDLPMLLDPDNPPAPETITWAAIEAIANTKP